MYVRQAVPISFVHYSARRKCTNGKESGCRSAMKDVMNAEVVESGAHMKILNGSIQKADMGLCSGWRKQEGKEVKIYCFY